MHLDNHTILDADISPISAISDRSDQSTDHESYLGGWRKRLREFRESLSGRIMTAAFAVAAMTVLVKLAALLKEILVAHRFGAGDALDAFYIAVLLPTFLAGIVGDSFNAAFIPVYVEIRETAGAQASQRLLANVAAAGLSALFAAAVLLGLFSDLLLPLLGSGFAPQKLAVARLLMLPLLGSLALSGLNSLWRAALTVHDGFAVSAITPIAHPLLVLVTLVAFAANLGIYALAYGTLLGSCGDLVLCGYALKKRGIALRPHWHGFDQPLRRVLMQYLPMVAGAMLLGSTVLIDQSMAATLDAGSVSALNYANKLVMLPLLVGVYSMAVAIFPSFSRLDANGDWIGLRRILATYTRLILVVSVPVTLLLIIFSQQLVALFFQGGAFSRSDTHLVGEVVALFSFQIPFYALGMLYVRAISAIKRNQILMWGTVISVALNAGLNLVLMRLIGLAGIALSTSIVYFISCCYLRLTLTRALSQREAQTLGPMCAIPSGSPS
jgi:putative peptidoglycan lipid II flippase